MLDQSLSQFILVAVTIISAVLAALWLGLVLWTFRDMRTRSRDVLAQVAAALMVAVLNVFGVLLYLMLRPHETLAEAYERSLEEESLLQGIEEKPICPGCGRPSDALWQVCPHCHTRLKKPCIACGELLDLPWNLCPYCATPQANEAQSNGRGRRNVAAPVMPINNSPDAEDEGAQEAALEFVDNDEF